jgi:hypothetical protein
MSIPYLAPETEVRVYVDWACKGRSDGGIHGYVAYHHEGWLAIDTPGEYATKQVIIREMMIGQIEIVRPVEKPKETGYPHWALVSDRIEGELAPEVRTRCWHYREVAGHKTRCDREILFVYQVCEGGGMPVSDGHPRCAACDTLRGLDAGELDNTSIDGV